jgi:hypothetical protein
MKVVEVDVDVALRRLKITERDANLLRLWTKVSGHYDLFRELKHPS